MAASGSSKSAQERREAQREALRKQRESELRRQRTVRTVVIAAVTVAALVIVAGAGYLIYRTTRPAGPVAVPAGMAQDQPYLSFGAEEGSGAPVVELHLDFMCPYCGQFEQINGEDVAALVEDDAITLHLVPRRMLDTASTTGDYSSRAANAMVCVYEENPDAAMAFQQLMFANQPAEGTAGLTDDQIWDYAQQAGATEAVQGCLTSRTYQPWVRQVAEPYASEMQKGTPYIAIDGTQFGEWTTEGAFLAAVQAAGGSTASDAGGAEASDGGEG
ncbi:thioredoxin domain-containing protein [Brachybacterium sp. J144]|uniref:DsbA family protein n=1 Tax=Brachybacterium sp. J144 TaxID=3116487 RepID=UPI002E79AE86|nr:thioredoxin domain-containing protein [Brachybacterium sp. J144]MEE1651570.1 thioredoxin domain-containing protein [Brachybacterium sp. J144]